MPVTKKRFRFIAENIIWLLISSILIGAWFWSTILFVVLISTLVAGIAAKFTTFTSLGPPQGD